MDSFDEKMACLEVTLGVINTVEKIELNSIGKSISDDGEELKESGKEDMFPADSANQGEGCRDSNCSDHIDYNISSSSPMTVRSKEGKHDDDDASRQNSNLQKCSNAQKTNCSLRNIFSISRHPKK